MTLVDRSQRYSIKEVSDLLDVHYGTVAGWITNGVRGRKLKSHFYGGRRFIHRVDLEEFVTGETSPKSLSVSVRKREAQMELERLGVRKQSES